MQSEEEPMKLPLFSLPKHIEKAWDFYTNKLKSPKFITAPMVDQSDLAFRLLTRKYHADLCYTPMLNSKIILQDKNYLKSNLEIDKNNNDSPLFIQLCGNDPQIMLKAAQTVEKLCDAIDINLGCPQGIAKKGHYGSFLLSEPDLVCEIVRTLNENLSIPVTCKIRILKKEEDTIDLCKRLEAAGCWILTVHGRTKEQNKDLVGKVNWEIVKKIRNTIKIPMFCNGGIYTFEDIERCLAYTGVQGVMSSEALLENPCLFSGKIYDLDKIAMEYLEFCKICESDNKYIKPHLFKMLHSGLKIHHDLRDRLAKANNFNEFFEIAAELLKRRENQKPEEKFGWYLRHQKLWEIQGGNQENNAEINKNAEENKKEKEDLIEEMKVNLEEEKNRCNSQEKEENIGDFLLKKRKINENFEINLANLKN